MALSEKHRSTPTTSWATRSATTKQWESCCPTSHPANWTNPQPVISSRPRFRASGPRSRVSAPRSPSQKSGSRYVHQELAGFRSEMAGFRTEIVGIRAEVAQLRAGIDGLRSDMNRTNQWMIGLVITLVLGLIASQFIGG